SASTQAQYARDLDAAHNVQVNFQAPSDTNTKNVNGPGGSSGNSLAGTFVPPAGSGTTAGGPPTPPPVGGGTGGGTTGGGGTGTTLVTIPATVFTLPVSNDQPPPGITLGQVLVLDR